MQPNRSYRLINDSAFARDLAKRSKVSVDISWEVMDNITALIKEKMAAGEEVNIKGWSSFGVKLMRSKNHYSGFTKLLTVIPEYYKFTYKFSEKLFPMEGTFRKPVWKKK